MSRLAHFQHLCLILQPPHQLSDVQVILTLLPPQLLHFYLYRPQGTPVILFLPLLSRHELDQLPVLVDQVTNASIALCLSLVHLELVGRFPVQYVVTLLFDPGKLSLQGAYCVLTLLNLLLQLMALSTLLVSVCVYRREEEIGEVIRVG